eukprot:scaffold14308_cov126-Skeletonema_menzelii.AAC.2
MVHELNLLTIWYSVVEMVVRWDGGDPSFLVLVLQKLVTAGCKNWSRKGQKLCHAELQIRDKFVTVFCTQTITNMMSSILAMRQHTSAERSKNDK